MKSILLHVFSDDQFDNRLSVALDLCRTTGAHLTCLQVTPYDAFVAMDPIGGMPFEAFFLEQLRTDELETRKRAEARLAAAGVGWDWQMANGDVAGAVVGGASLHDLVVVSQSARRRGSNSEPLPIVDDVVVAARCGVLVVPSGVDRFDAHVPAMVAWNASPEAASAVRFALPLLKLAASVAIVSVGEDEDLFPQTAASVYLSRHGISSDLHPLPQTGYSTDETLARFAEEHRIGLLVMGVYGHSRLREMLLGGATRQLLAKSEVPLLTGC